MTISPTRTPFICWMTATLLAVLTPLAYSQGDRSVSPVELVRSTVDNEVKSSNQHAKFMFREHKATPKGSQTKLLVETRDAMAGMLVAVNDRPLTPEERKAEEARLNRFLHDPEEIRKRAKQEKEDNDRVTRIMKALPDAFIYEPDGKESGKQGVGAPGDELVRLKFRPNPNYNPPSRVEQVLTTMQGVLLVDANKRRIARIDGVLSKDVGFGWGILGHLDRGGRFLVEQGEVGQGHWEVTHMDLSFTGKAFFFKNLTIKSNEVYSDFTPVAPDLSFAQGLELLKKQEALLASNQGQNPQAERK